MQAMENGSNPAQSGVQEELKWLKRDVIRIHIAANSLAPPVLLAA